MTWMIHSVILYSLFIVGLRFKSMKYNEYLKDYHVYTVMASHYSVP